MQEPFFQQEGLLQLRGIMSWVGVVLQLEWQEARRTQILPAAAAASAAAVAGAVT